MILSVVDKHTFDKSDYRCVFSNKSTDRCYALVTEESHSFKFAWRSDMVSVNSLMIKSHTYAVGIDENFAIIDFKADEIVLHKHLDFIFHEFKLVNGSLLIATELEIIIFDTLNNVIVRKLDLPDTYERMEILNGSLRIRCFDGATVEDVLPAYPLS